MGVIYSFQSFYPFSDISEKRKTYKSRDSTGPWGCICRLRPSPATHDVATKRVSNWWTFLTGVEGWTRILTNRRGALRHVETSAARPQIAGSKQSREELAAAICGCRIPTLHYNRLADIITRTFAKRTGLICSAFLNKTALRGQTHELAMRL